jgi:uncharacterized protein
MGSEKFATYLFIKIALVGLCMVYSKSNPVAAQTQLYSNSFPLGDVVIKDQRFAHARDLNIQTLLQYDVDRLLAGYRKEAGLPAKAVIYPNWDGLDGHVAGHYLSALAMNYAATGNTACRDRMLYMLTELKACQDAHNIHHTDWGKGYVGAVPESQKIWSALLKADLSALRNAWVPWYNVHKMYAGLRDAWLYAGNETAKTLFLNFCAWGINVISTLNEEQMQSMLDIEHGGMNEIFADAYQMTGDEKYLQAAKRFSHRMLLDAMAQRKDNLDNKHANTQVPKAIGFQRIAELTHDKTYITAGQFFWETVTQNRTLAFGGNSRREFFPSITSSTDFITEVEGPESCNSYNMLRLSADLFRVSTDARYMDYYERTIYNHILSTQHPEHGGYVYFTPVRPRHYRVYSAPNKGMWCCVGSGMENHGRYNELIYTHQQDSLYVNLFMASVLQWKAKGLVVEQQTRFPEEEKTRLLIKEGNSRFTMMIRYPSWVAKAALKIKVNGQPVAYQTNPSSYIAVQRIWKKGDLIEIQLPMQNHIEQMPNVANYVAVLHGPVVLAARAGTEEMKGLIADDSRWGHIASGKRLPVNEAPVLIADNPSAILKSLQPLKGKPLHFTFSNLKMGNTAPVELEPFYQLHDARYMLYWMTLTEAAYQSYVDSLAKMETARLALQKRTVDVVIVGEQQPEADHLIQQKNTATGNRSDEFWREVRNGGTLSYTLTTNQALSLSLRIRYWGAERGNRKFDIYIDDQLLLTENLTDKWNEQNFKEIEYVIPDSMLKDKKQINISCKPQPGNTAGAFYQIRLVKQQ